MEKNINEKYLLSIRNTSFSLFGLKHDVILSKGHFMLVRLDVIKRDPNPKNNNKT